MEGKGGGATTRGSGRKCCTVRGSSTPTPHNTEPPQRLQKHPDDHTEAWIQTDAPPKQALSLDLGHDSTESLRLITMSFNSCIFPDVSPAQKNRASRRFHLQPDHSKCCHRHRRPANGTVQYINTLFCAGVPRYERRICRSYLKLFAGMDGSAPAAKGLFFT